MRFCDLASYGVSHAVIEQIPEALAAHFKDITQPNDAAPATPATPAAAVEPDLFADIDLTGLPELDTSKDLTILLRILVQISGKKKGKERITYNDTCEFWQGKVFRDQASANPADKDKLNHLALKAASFLPLVRGTLCVQASEVQSERLFSAAGFLQSDRRARLPPHRLEELTIVKSATPASKEFADQFADAFLRFHRAQRPQAKRNKDAEVILPEPAESVEAEVVETGSVAAPVPGNLDEAVPLWEGTESWEGTELNDSEEMVYTKKTRKETPQEKASY